MTLFTSGGGCGSSNSRSITVSSATFLVVFCISVAFASAANSTDLVDIGTKAVVSLAEDTTTTTTTAANRRTSTVSSSDYLARRQQSYIEKISPDDGRKKHREAGDKQRGPEKTNRQRRQLSLGKTSSTRDRSPGLLKLSFLLVRDTINDTTTAYRNISRIVSDVIRQAGEPAPSTDDQQMMGSAQASTPSTNANQASAQNAVSRILGRNFRGLRRLFDSELRSAIGNTGQNVREFRQELTRSILNSLRPSQIFTRGNGTNTNSL